MSTKKRYWTTTEVRFLREHLGPMTVKQVARELGREPAAVKTKALELGISTSASRKAYRDGEHQRSLHHHPFFGPLLRPIGQPTLPRHKWTAFDEVRGLMFYGVVSDEQLSVALNRSQSALVTRRYYYRWNKQKAANLRRLLETDDELRDTLDQLRETGEPRIPPEFTLKFNPNVRRRSRREKNPTDIPSAGSAGDTTHDRLGQCPAGTGIGTRRTYW